MDLAGRVVVITGAGSGIGRAMAIRFATEDLRGLVVADRDGDRLETVAASTGAVPLVVDVAAPEGNDAMVTLAETRFGPVDLFCANAGIGAAGSEQDPPETWDSMWQVNLMSHVHAARRLLPGWLERGHGYFLATASAAGLLTNLRAAQYSVTKHAAVAFAEWLAVTYGSRGVKVSCLCPMGVRTPFLDAAEEFHRLLDPHAIEPEAVANAVVAGVAAERFLILPHPEVARFYLNKAEDYDRWIAGMRRLQDRVFPNPDDGAELGQ